MDIHDIRWKQRFQNFETAFAQLEQAVAKENVTPLEMAGVVQTFEFTFELAWKTLKDYLEEKKVSARFPKDVIKEAHMYELITDGEIWMDMLDKRNLMSHTYNETLAKVAYRLITGKYFQAIAHLLRKLKSEH